MANKIGMGLDLLLSEVSLDPEDAGEAKTQIQQLVITSLRPGKYQPRIKFKANELQLLADSIKQHGVLQPLVVRQVAGTDGYEIIAGERRWRASQQAGLDKVPAVVRTLTDKQAMALALIENLQRENLTTWELVVALQHLIDKFKLSHEQAGSLIGYSRTSISNLLRLMDLPKPVQRLLEDEKIEMGHARALLAVTDPVKCAELAEQAVAKQLTVRALESLIRLHLARKSRGAKHLAASRKSVYQELASDLASKFNLNLKVKEHHNGGAVLVTFKQKAALEAFLTKLKELASH